MNDIRKAIWHSLDPYEGFHEWAGKDVPLDGWDIRSKVIEDEIRNTGAKLVLEVGSHRGASACWMAEVMGEDGHVLTIDPWTFYGKYKYDHRLARFAYARDYFRKCVVAYGLCDRITYLPMRSDDAFRMFENSFSEWRFDFGYVDGGHSYEQCSRDLENVAKYVTGSIVVDDYHPEDWPGVTDAVDEFAEKHGRTKTIMGRKAVLRNGDTNQG